MEHVRVLIHNLKSKGIRWHSPCLQRLGAARVGLRLGLENRVLSLAFYTVTLGSTILHFPSHTRRSRPGRALSALNFERLTKIQAELKGWVGLGQMGEGREPHQEHGTGRVVIREVTESWGLELNYLCRFLALQQWDFEQAI